MRDFLSIEMKNAHSKNMIYGQLLKFYPLAFWVVDNDSITSPPRLGRFNSVPPWEERELTINLGEVRESDFPEAPKDFRATFFGSAGAATAHAKPRRRRRLL
jgi:hypothetical protein